MDGNRWKSPPKIWKKLKPVARQMRREAVPAEQILWSCLRNRKVRGCKFRRQHAIGQFIADFYCMESKLVIEVDGPTHENTQEADKLRQEFFEALGLRVIRFSNSDVYRRLKHVVEEIERALTPHP